MNSRMGHEVRYRLLTIINDESDLTQRQIAKKMGISLGKVNYVIAELAKKGLVKIKRVKNSRNKLGYAYILTPKGIEEKAAVTMKFLKRKIRKYDEIKRQIEELTAEVEDLEMGRSISSDTDT